MCYSLLLQLQQELQQESISNLNGGSLNGYPSGKKLKKRRLKSLKISYVGYMAWDFNSNSNFIKCTASHKLLKNKIPLSHS